MATCSCGRKGKKGERVVSERGTYSVYYTPPNADSYMTYALDFNFFKKGQWSPSQREGVRWYESSESGEVMHKVLLEHFGLEDWKKEFPLKRIVTMSPYLLAMERRKKERAYDLPWKNILSNTVGYHVPADNHR